MSSIDIIKDEVRIEQLLPAGQLSLSQGGSKIPCPLPGHSKDKTPSFHIYEGENRFKCFGCGKAGSVLDLQMELTGQTFSEALRALADLAGIKLEPLTPEQEQQAVLAELRAKALGLYVAHCMARLYPKASGVITQKAQAALDYMAGRGFDAEFLKEHQVGLDDGSFAKNLGTIKSELEALGLTQADFVLVQDADGRWLPHPKSRTGLGLVRFRDSKVSAPFRDRLVIPIFSRGKAVGLTARALGDTENTAKYMHLQAPQTCLYLEDRIRKDRPVYLVEGPMDALAITKAGGIAVAQFGTAGFDRARRLDVASAIYLLLDNDAAGRAATARAGAGILAKGLVPYVLNLPQGVKDPGDWLLSGLDEAALNEASKAAIAWPILAAKEVEKAAPHDRNLLQTKLMDVGRKVGPGPAFTAVQKALKILGVDIKGIEKPAKEEASTKGTIVFDEDTSPPIIPVFQVVPQAGGHLVRFTTPLKVARSKATKKGDTIQELVLELVLVEGQPDPKSPSGRSYTMRPLDDLKLSPLERDRCIQADEAEVRWRPSGGPHSVESVVRQTVGPVDLAWLHDQLRGCFARYIWMRDPRLLDLLACFTLTTYVFDLWDAVPYLHLWGMRETAKSNVANLLVELAFNAVSATNQTPAVVFRTAHATRGLRIFEEAESLSDPKPNSPQEDLRLLANAGYKRGAKAQRMEKIGERMDVKSYDAYGPKVFASIEALENVLASRCIKVHMVRASASDLAQFGIKDMARERKHLRELIPSLRDACYAAALQRIDDIENASTYLQEGPLLEHLLGRQREMWVPILSVACAAMVDQAVAEAEASAGGQWDHLDAAEQEERWQACLDRLEQDPQSLLNRMIELQKELERVAKAEESEASLEVATLKALYAELSNGDRIAPLRKDPLQQRQGWEIKLLSTEISKDLEEAGFRPRGNNPVMGSKRLMSLLDKVGVTRRSDRFEDRYAGRSEKVRGVYVDLRLLIGALSRFGVSVEGEGDVATGAAFAANAI